MKKRLLLCIWISDRESIGALCLGKNPITNNSEHRTKIELVAPKLSRSRGCDLTALAMKKTLTKKKSSQKPILLSQIKYGWPAVMSGMEHIRNKKGGPPYWRLTQVLLITEQPTRSQYKTNV